MKLSREKQHQFRLERIEAVVESRMAALFGRLPELCGFSVGADLQPHVIATHCWPGSIAGEELFCDIVETLSGLIEERAETPEVIRGRTFARAIQ
jgi:hypothetical protein